MSQLEPIPQAVVVPVVEQHVAVPNTLVVFKRRGADATTRVLAKHLGFSMAMAERSEARPDIVSFAARSADEAAPRIYERIGIAALDAHGDQLSSLKDNPDIEAVVPNEYRRIPPLPELRDGEGTVRAAAAAGQFTWGISAIGADRSAFSGRGVRIAVLDTGIDLDHPDFAGRIAATKVFVPNVATVQDGHGHGTHCAGSAAGARVPAAGPRFGVAPDAELVIGKVLSDNGGGYDEWILNGLSWAQEQGAKVVSMSIGGSRTTGEAHNIAYQRVLEQLAANGIFVVMAAGNESQRPNFVAPINSPGAEGMAIAAVDSSLKVATFSCAEAVNDWARLFVSGPGVDIWSAWRGAAYKSISGTSMATPHVAGVAALLIERTAGISVKQLTDELRRSVQVLPSRPADVGAGLVRAP